MAINYLHTSYSFHIGGGGLTNPRYHLIGGNYDKNRMG